MKIAVMGTGGVGGVFGARLAAAGHEVSFIARGKHLEAILANGLRIVSPERGDVIVKPAHATADPADVGPVDLILFTVKLWDTESGAEQIRPMIGESTTVMSLQNGIDKDEILSRILGAKHVLPGISYISSSVSKPGEIVQRGTWQTLVFGELDGTLSKRGKEILEACLSAKFEAELSENIESRLWEKFIFLSAMALVTSITRLPIGPVRSTPGSRRLLVDVMSEAIAVARAKNITLPENLLDKRMEYFDGLTPDVMSSMSFDLVNGNKLEMPYLSGTILRLGSELNVPTPVTGVLVDALSPYVTGTPKEMLIKSRA